MIVEPFTIDHYRALAGEKATQAGLNAACLNQISGPAFTLMDDGKVLAIGGIQVQGIGQAWAMLSEEARPRDVVEAVIPAARAAIERAMAQEKLFRVFAWASVDAPGWFKRLGFVPQQLFVR
jgi:hypothetical protein